MAQLQPMQPIPNSQPKFPKQIPSHANSSPGVRCASTMASASLGSSGPPLFTGMESQSVGHRPTKGCRSHPVWEPAEEPHDSLSLALEQNFPTSKIISFAHVWIKLENGVSSHFLFPFSVWGRRQLGRCEARHTKQTQQRVGLDPLKNYSTRPGTTIPGGMLNGFMNVEAGATRYP